MKMEDVLTAEEKAELEYIDRRIAELCIRKLEIQTRANCRYIPETDEGLVDMNRLHEYLTYGMGVIPKEVVRIKVEE